MLDSEILIYNRRAGVQHVQSALALAFILALTCVATFPYRWVQLPKIVAFIPVIDAMHVLFSAIIAAVLLSLASIVRSRALIVLGTGYVFIGFIAVTHALTYPDTFFHTGNIDADVFRVTWLYMVWHTVLPVSIIAYALLKETPHRLDDPAFKTTQTIFACVIGAAVAAAGTTWLATTASPIVSEVLRPLVFLHYWHYLVMPLTGMSVILLLFGRRSILDLCLMLTLWAWLLEYVVIFPGPARFSVGWYAGRAMGLSSGMFVLLMLIIEMTRLYARTAILIAVQKRERENRVVLGEAVGAFIAHELRQPLAAIMLNASTAQTLGGPAGGKLSALMDDLKADSRRANEIIESTRAIFGKSAGQKCPTDINQLVRDTLLMMSRELKSHGVTVDVQLKDHLPLVVISPIQIQQVFMNLFINAAEAMSEVANRPRKLTVQSSSSDAGVIIQVQDTGPGLNGSDRDRIFDPFFTTKKYGSGIGLSICCTVIEAHGGSIQMKPGTPFGVRFEIVLPNPDAGSFA